MNILTDFFNFLPSLMMAIGPISIYAGMGTGSQSGRMQFKQIFTDDLVISDGIHGITFSNPDYLNREKIILNTINVGSFQVISDYASMSGTIKAKLDQYLSGLGSNMYFTNPNYEGTYVSILTSHNTVTERISIEWISLDLTTGSRSDLIGPGQIIDNIINYFENKILFTGQIRLDCEIFMYVERTIDQPRNAKLVNPLFNSFRANKEGNSMHFSTGSVKQYLNRTTKNGKRSIGLGPDGVDQTFLGGWSTYNANGLTGSSNILGKVYQATKDPQFYGDLSYQFNACFVNNGTTASMGNFEDYSVGRSVYVETMKRVYSKYSVPSVVHSFGILNKLNRHNFYGDLFYDNNGFDSVTYSTSWTSSCVAQAIDTYRIYDKGETANIYFNTDRKLDNLLYDFGNYKYLNSDGTGGNVANRNTESLIQVVPYYSQVYIIYLTVDANPDGAAFYSMIMSDYYVKSDRSITNSTTGSNYFVNTEFERTISDQTTFDALGRPALMIHSNDDLMTTLGGKIKFDYDFGTIYIDAIYKGNSFRPFLYPLNFQQLLLEVPSNYDTIDYVDINSINATFSFSTPNITNKKLRFLIYNKKSQKYKLINASLSATLTRVATDNKISMLTTTTKELESIITAEIGNFRKNLKPGSIEILMCFYDTITHKNSLITNYKIIIDKYGKNEVFRIISVPDNL